MTPFPLHKHDQFMENENKLLVKAFFSKHVLFIFILTDTTYIHVYTIFR